MTTPNLSSLNPSLTNTDTATGIKSQTQGQSFDPYANVNVSQQSQMTTDTVTPTAQMPAPVVDTVTTTTIIPETPKMSASSLDQVQETMSAGSGMGQDNTPPSFTPRKKGMPVKLVVLGVFLLLFLLIGSLFTVGALAAYDKIKLPGNLNRSLSGMVSKLGFMPKSNQMIFDLMQKSMDEKNSLYVDLSVAVEAPELDKVAAFLPGFDKMEMVIKGPIDATDGNDIKTSLNMSVNNMFEMDFTSLTKMGYFRFNKLPSFIDMYLSPSASGAIKNKWVEFDYANLDSEASKALDEKSDELSTKRSIAEKRLTDYFAQNVIPNMKQSSEKVDNFDTYKLQTNLSESQMDEITKIMQDYSALPTDLNATNGTQIVKITNATMDVWVDKKEYVLRKATMTFKMEFSLPADAYTNVLGVTAASNSQLMADDQASKVQEATFAVAVKFSQFGEQFDIQKPTNTVKVEKYMMDLYQISGPIFMGAPAGGANPNQQESMMQDDTESSFPDTMGFE